MHDFFLVNFMKFVLSKLNVCLWAYDYILLLHN